MSVIQDKLLPAARSVLINDSWGLRIASHWEEEGLVARETSHVITGLAPSGLPLQLQEGRAGVRINHQ